MQPNEAGFDRILRIVAGLALIGLAFTGTIGLWGYLGVVLLATGLIGWCPIYKVLGIHTCAVKIK